MIGILRTRSSPINGLLVPLVGATLGPVKEVLEEGLLLLAQWRVQSKLGKQVTTHTDLRFSSGSSPTRLAIIDVVSVAQGTNRKVTK